MWTAEQMRTAMQLLDEGYVTCAEIKWACHDNKARHGLPRSIDTAYLMRKGDFVVQINYDGVAKEV